MRRHWIISILVALAVVGAASVASAGSFSSGSTGAQGAFPPTTPPAGTTGIKLDLNTGVVTYTPSNTTATLPNVPAGGFQNGTLNFTTFTLATGITLTFIKNAANTPVTLLFTGAVTITGTLSVDGLAGKNAISSTIFPSAGAGGPGGFDGGAGANNVVTSVGGSGQGPGGGTAGPVPVTGGTSCHASGGGFGSTAPTVPSYTYCSPVPGGPAYANPQLLPLVGGSGGGGGTMLASAGQVTAGGGGGGGGAILLASSGTITVTGTIAARGGAGGNAGTGGAGGGGSGGAVRLVATTLAGSGSILATGGAGGVGGGGAGGTGRIRLEGYTNTMNVTVTGVNPSLDIPRGLSATGFPSLTITTIGGQTVPATPTGSFYSVDVTLPSSAPSPVAVVVTATNIPAGTPVLLKAKPLTGAVTTVTTPGLSGGTATANLAMDLAQPNLVSAEATFTITSALDSPIKYAGEDVTTATVTAGLGGASQVRYYTASGKEVPEHAALALGLPR